MGLFDDLNIDLGGIDLKGFDIGDFSQSAEPDPMEDAIWTRPVVRAPKAVCYEHAQDFADALTIDNETETFAYVAGGFVFGDFLDALVESDRISVRRLGMQMLSLNDENIDSLRNVVEMCGTERLDLCLSGYWYSTEMHKGGVVGYLFDQLDLEGLELHVAIAELHCKVLTIETWAGNRLTMHGSANLRSSNSIEQIHISPDPALYEFCAGVTDRIVGAYDVVMQERRRNNKRSRRLGGKRLWQAIRDTGSPQGAREAEGAEAPRSAGSPRRPSESACSAQRTRADGPTYTARCPSDEPEG
ncbi:MAG: hypothetical protein IKG69_11770 [Atopobiaceae bacterium]|nr:hypothetical protein [Atopobiaceae bacterium]